MFEAIQQIYFSKTLFIALDSQRAMKIYRYDGKFICSPKYQGTNFLLTNNVIMSNYIFTSTNHTVVSLHSIRYHVDTLLRECIAYIIKYTQNFNHPNKRYNRKVTSIFLG